MNKLDRLIQWIYRLIRKQQDKKIAKEFWKRYF